MSLPQQTNVEGPIRVPEGGGFSSVDLLKTNAVARILNLSLSRVRQLGDAGALTMVRGADGARLFDATDVERMRTARSRPTIRMCRFCGSEVQGQATYCRREFCRRARNRLRQQRFTRRFQAHYGMTYRSARRELLTGHGIRGVVDEGS